MCRRFLWARFGSDTCHFNPYSIGREVAFHCVPRKRRAVDIGEHWCSVPHWSGGWIKGLAQYLAHSRDSTMVVSSSLPEPPAWGRSRRERNGLCFLALAW